MKVAAVRGLDTVTRRTLAAVCVVGSHQLAVRAVWLLGARGQGVGGRKSGGNGAAGWKSVSLREASLLTGQGLSLPLSCGSTDEELVVRTGSRLQFSVLWLLKYSC